MAQRSKSHFNTSQLHNNSLHFKFAVTVDAKPTLVNMRNKEMQRRRMHCEGYDVPVQTLRIQTVDSDQDCYQQQPSQEEVDLQAVLIASHADQLIATEARVAQIKGGIKLTKYLIETRGTRTHTVDTKERMAPIMAGDVVRVIATCSSWRR